MPEQRTNPNYTFDPAYRWDSDDAEVTIPGRDVPRHARAARGASRRHAGDSGDRRRGEQPAELDQRRVRLRRRAPHLTLSNVANGGAYDDTSGVALTMGEYQALLRWYQANHTYPSKTLKVALLDASAGRAHGRDVPARGREVLRATTSSRRGRRASTRCSRR